MATRSVPLQIGVRELRDNLKHVLDAVRSGAEITITERGKPVARLSSVEWPSNYERLVADGTITPARAPRRPSESYRRIKTKGTVSDLIPEQRR